MSTVVNIYNKFDRFPMGKKIFSKLVCFKAPYFGSVKPVFEELEKGRCVISMKKSRSVQNHLKSVHAIAMCNISELAAGTMLECSIPRNMRWIPSGMTVEYLKVARTDLTGVCELPDVDWDTVSELPLTVDVTDTNGVLVFRAVITMYISPKK